MKIDVTAKIQHSNIDKMVPESIISNMYTRGSSQMSQEKAAQIMQNVVIPMRQRVSQYNKQFDDTFKNWAESDKNSVLYKMADAIQNPTKGSARQKLGLQRSDYLDKNNSNIQNMMEVMQQGHHLLLELREQLTKQKIKTKFIISCDGETYEINESDIQLNYTLSRFGADTVSNPVSLAYVMTRELLQQLIKEKKAIKISDKNTIWSIIASHKRPYLDDKKAMWAAKGIEKEYPNIFFDSKDAEIYELYNQQRNEPEELTLGRYAELRQSMGGGGGYASPFYKIGDIGNVQVKYFNLKKNEQSTAVNFARFSLLRDQLRKLESYLSSDNIIEITNNLIKFFTENETNITRSIDKAFNETAKQTILSTLGW